MHVFRWIGAPVASSGDGGGDAGGREEGKGAARADVVDYHARSAREGNM